MRYQTTPKGGETVQAVPYTAFTTKSIEPGNSAKPVQSSSYGMRNQAKKPAFAQTFQRATQELSGQSNEPAVSKPANFKPQGKATDDIANSKQSQNLVSTETSVDPAMNLMQQLLEILQMLGLAGDTQLTGQTVGGQTDCQPQTGNQAQSVTSVVTSGLAQLPQTPTLAALIKALAGQDENLQEILGQLQKDLQQLGKQFNENGGLPNQGQDKLAAIRQELLTALEQTDGDFLSDQDFLVKLAGAVAKIAAKSAIAGESSDPKVLTVSKPDDTSQNVAGSQTTGNTPVLGDNHLGVQARSTPSQVAGDDQNSEVGLANKLFGQVEVKQVEAKPTEAKSTGVVDVKYPGGFEKSVPVNMKSADTASVNSNQGQNEFRLQDQNNVLIQNNADFTQVQSSKVPEPPLNIPRMAQVIFGQITQKAKLLVTPGTTEMQIQLKPDFLGKMNLSITSENGVVTAKFNTESYRVKEIIEANLNTLKDSLAQQGVKVDQLVVNVSSQKDYSGYQEQNHSYYHHNPGKNTKTAGTLNEEGFEKLFPADLESKNVQAYYGNTVDFKA